METIKIVSASDDGYVQHLCTMFASLLENASFKKSIELYVIDGGISENNKKMLRLCTSMHNCSLQFLAIRPELYEKFAEAPCGSPVTYFRIFVPHLMNAAIEKAIYLDCDMIIKKDIAELWNTDVSQFFLAAVEDCGIEEISARCNSTFKEDLGMSKEDKYFNAGVMVMNLVKWREHNISDKVADLLIENSDKFYYADQDALNVVLRNQWMPLPMQWNQQLRHLKLFAKGKEIPEDMLKAVQEPWVIHYTTSDKPWSYMNTHPFKKEYYKYLRLTPWKNFVPADRNIKNMSLKLISKIPSKEVFIKHLNKYRSSIKSVLSRIYKIIFVSHKKDYRM